MKRIEWDLMRPQDIEIRPAMVKDGKATLLLYQNSRTAMDALDRNFGEFGWKMEYKDVGGQIYGRLSIKDPETGEWIYKEDTGEESNIAAEKGMSSDILKRCIVRFGYGRELYTAPRIVIDDDGYGFSGYKVGRIEYSDNREIISLDIVNRFGKIVFSWRDDDGIVNTPQPQYQQHSQPDMNDKTAGLHAFCDSIKGQGLDFEIEKFKVWWEPKVKNWKGNFDPERLWSSWCSRIRN